MASQAGRGAQVRLSGDAQAAARGVAASTQEGNRDRKRALELAGLVADGSTLDGSSQTGLPAFDEVLSSGDPSNFVMGANGDSQIRYHHANLAQLGPSYAYVDCFEAVGPLNWANCLMGQAFDFPSANNIAISGTGTAAILVASPGLIGKRCAVILLGGGTNDLPTYADAQAAGNPALEVTVAQTVSNRQATALAHLAQAKDVLLLGIPPRQTWSGRGSAYWTAMAKRRITINRQLEAWCATQDHIHYVDPDLPLAAWPLIEGSSDQTGGTYTNNSGSTPDTWTLPSGQGFSTTTDAYAGMQLLLYNSGVATVSRMIVGQSGLVLTLEGTDWPTTGSTNLEIINDAGGDIVQRNDGGSFITDGFQDGMAITVSGFTTNGATINGTLARVLSASQVQLTTTSLVTEAAGTGRTIRQQTPGGSTKFAIAPSGVPKAAMMWDGLHWDLQGAYRMGAALKPVLEKLVQPHSTPLSRPNGRYHPTSNPKGDLLKNGTLLGKGATVATPFSGDLAPGWSLGRGATYGSTGTFTVAKETQADGVVSQNIVISDLTGGAGDETYYLRQALLSSANTWQAGQTIEAWMEVDLTGLANVRGIWITMSLPRNGAGDSFVLCAMDVRANVTTSYWPSGDIGRMTFRTPPYTIPDFTGLAAPTLDLRLNFKLDGLLSGGGVTAKVRRAAVPVI